MRQPTINAVYLGTDQDLQRYLARAAGNFMKVKSLFSADETFKTLETRCIDIVCLDHRYPETMSFLREFPLARLSKFYFVIAVATSETSARRLTNRGVQYVTTQQNATTELPQMVKACVSLIRLEQRQKPRTAMHLPAMIRHGANEQWSPAMITDISESGCRITTNRFLSSDGDISLRFQIGETDMCLDAFGRVIWTDSVGQAGLLFSYIYPAQFLQLRAWLSRRYGRIFLPQAEPIQGWAAVAH